MAKRAGKPVIAFLGVLPPPIGGFSVPLQRLTRRLEEAGLEYVVYDLLNMRAVRRGGAARPIGSRAWWLLRYLFTAKEDLVCCHYIDWRVRVLVGLMGLRGKKALLSVGGQSLQDSLEKGWLRRKLIAFALRRYSFVIAHNTVIRQLCLSLGVRPERTAVIPNFIPPPVRQEEIEAIPPEVWEFIGSHDPVISANASALTFYHGEDLYGLDLCVELGAGLKPRFPRLGLVFCLPAIGDADYFGEIGRRIAARGLNDGFRFVTGAYPLYPILMQSRVFLRPTNTDGDANSLREALFFKVPSVASDVVPRPEGTIIFKNRDITDLTLKVGGLLDNYAAYQRTLDDLMIEDNSVKLLELYRRLIGSRAPGLQAKR
jgi:glycosyltransferase involved in cell wall biosynthesis